MYAVVTGASSDIGYEISKLAPLRLILPIEYKIQTNKTKRKDINRYKE